MLPQLLALVTLVVSVWLLVHVRRMSARACPRCGHVLPGVSGSARHCPGCGWGNGGPLQWARAGTRR